MRRLIRQWRWCLAKALTGDRAVHRWDMSRFDRLYVDRLGREHILDGAQGHTSALGFHHGPRRRCPACADGIRYTEHLPRRWPGPEPTE